jgi:hypothetical protein
VPAPLDLTELADGEVRRGQHISQAEYPPRLTLQQRQHVGSVEAFQHQTCAGIAIHDVEQPRRDAGIVEGPQCRRFGAMPANAGAVQLEHGGVAVGVHV